MDMHLYPTYLKYETTFDTSHMPPTMRSLRQSVSCRAARALQLDSRQQRHDAHARWFALPTIPSACHPAAGA
eukprot:2237075-Prymnesium_polylepis.3